ncbi:MAG: NADH-quinone oxidoreductase subunit A [Muribaculaceae bacterium]|nr:NADH-quinone oxidoreductase subunit A [Muribaculaceae bacterium]MBQ7211375.1 NADH-quinone oxidoreductase subunit A [Muribaculaceae bacterium]
MALLTIQSTTLAVTALLTGATLVFAGLLVAKLMSPRSFNPQKGEPYECGIPTRGESMAQFRVGYYLYAILFLMFDVETVFLYPWAVNARQWADQFGPSSVTAVAVFFAILVLGLAYAWRKGALKWE